MTTELQDKEAPLADPDSFVQDVLADSDADLDEIDFAEASAEEDDEFEEQEWDASDLNLADDIRLYLDDIRREPLLSAAEEVQLAKQMEAYLPLRAKAMQNHVLDQQQFEQQLAALSYRERQEVKRGEDAFQRMIRANQRLVVKIAKGYVSYGMSLLDLCQEGNFGLIRAVEKFDWRRGFKFSTYATHWINQSLVRAIDNQSTTIRVPAHRRAADRKIARTRREMTKDGEGPSNEALAAKLGITIDEILDAEVRKDTLKTASLNAPIGEDSDELGGVLPDLLISAEEHVERDELEATLAEALDKLDADTRKIVIFRWGLFGEEKHTLAEVGERLGIERERVRQAEAKALGRLSRNRTLKALLVQL